jgi:hypothetical protein
MDMISVSRPSGLDSLVYKVINSPEAEFLDEIRIFFLNSRSLLHISTIKLLYTVKQKVEKPYRKPYPLPYGFRNPYRNLKPENS